MKLSSPRARRGAALIGIAGAGTVLALGSAGAYVGGAGSGPLPTTNVPDLRSATVTGTVNPSDLTGPRVKFCFDGPIATVVSQSGLALVDYNAAILISAVSTVVDNQKPECVDSTFGNGIDIDQMSYGLVGQAVLQGNGGTNVALEAVPLTGSLLAPVSGATTVPDLVSAVRTGNTEITYTFDEKIRAGVNFPGNRFGYFQDSQDGNAPTLGTGNAVITNFTARVTFAAPISAEKQFIALGGAVQDVFGSSSTIGDAGTQISGSPGLDTATKNPDNQSVNLKFSQAVDPIAAAGVTAYREDGGLLPANALTTTDDSNNQTLKATLPPTAQKDNPSLVRIAVEPTAAKARSGANRVTASNAAIGTCKCTPGYTDGPDLLSTAINDATNTVNFAFDEPVDETTPPVATDFRLLQPDGTTVNGLDGVVLSSDRKTVTVHFGSSVSATVGVSNAYNATRDQTEELNASPESSVGKGPVDQGQTGSNPSPTPTVTAAPTVTVAPTVAPTVTPNKTVSRKSTISIKRKSAGKKYTGKVGAKSPCKSGRTVKIKRGSKTLKTVKTKSSGSYSAKVSKQKKGKIKATVSARTVKVGTTTYKCGAKTSKKV